MWNQFEELSEDAVFDHAFLVKTVFRVSKDVAGPHPKLNACYSNKICAIGVDDTLCIFDKEQFMDGKNLTFEAKIDCMAIVKEVVLCGLSNGCIYGVHASGIPLFSASIDEKDIASENCFVKVIEHNSEFHFCCKNGQIYKPLDVDIEKMCRLEQSDSAENTLNINETLSQEVSIAVINDKKCSNSIIAYNIITYGGQSLHIFSSMKFIYWFNEESQILGKMPIDGYKGIKKIEANDEVCILLAGNGGLYEFCPYTKFLNRIDTENGWPIIDFSMQDTNDDDIDVVILAQNAENEYYMKILDYKDLKSKWSLKVQKQSQLVMQRKSSACMYYLCAKNAVANNEKVDQIELMVVSEYRPEARLLTLLGRGLIVEAEQLADQFKLSKQPIYEAKAKNILNAIVSADPHDVDQIRLLFNQLTDIAQVMENHDFLLQLRNMQVAQRAIMRRYSQLLLQFLDAEKYKAILDEINEQMLRLNTLETFDPNECYMKWLDFVQQPSLSNVLLSFLKTDIPVACLILSRHSSNILDDLSDRKCLKFLSTIPKDAEPLQIVQWIHHFYPTITGTFPEFAPIIINWTIEKTISFEGNEEWPLIGIEFAKENQQIFEKNKNAFDNARRQQNSSEELPQVIFSLEELEVLKMEYNLRMPFKEYHESSINDRSMHLLRRTNLRNFRKLVENFIFVICREKGEDVQDILYTYIQQLIKFRKNNNSWLERATTCMGLLCDIKTKFGVALEIARVAPVPWDDAMKPIITLTNTSHTLAEKIKSEYHRMDFKVLLDRYGYQMDNPRVDHLKLLQRCIKCNMSPIDDINLIKKQAPSKVLRLNLMAVLQLLTNGRVDTATTFLAKLPQAEARAALPHVGSILIERIDDFIDTPDIYKGFLEVLKYVINKDSDSAYKAHVQQLINLHTLKQCDLQMVITMKDLEQTNAIQILLDRAVERILRALKVAKTRLVDKIYSYIRLLVNALKTNELLVVEYLARIVNDVHFSSLLAKMYIDHPTKDEHRIELAKLLVLQQYFAVANNKSIKTNENVSYAYPMAHQYLMNVRSTLEASDLFRFAGMVNAEFDFEMISTYRNDDGRNAETDQMILEILDKLSTVKQEAASQRRDSWSMFETVQVNMPTVAVDNKLEAAMKSFNDVLYVLVHHLKPKNALYETFKSIIPAADAFDHGKVFTALDALIKMKSFSTVYAILDFYKSQQKYAEKKFIGSSTYQMTLRKMLKFALQQKEPRADMLAIFLRSDSNPLHTLETLKQELSAGVPRLNCLQLCERYGQLTRNADLMNASKDARIKYDYYLQLRHIDNSLKDTFEITNPATLFNSLNKKVLDVEFLQRMSNDLDWNYQEVLVHQLITILQLYELSYDVVMEDVLGDEYITVNTSIEAIQSLYMPYLKQITDKKLLTNKIRHFIDSIEPHFYEMYMCALNMLHVVGALESFKDMKQWMDILVFLKSNMIKKRPRRIGQLEDDWWIRRYNETVLPTISKYRIPFMILAEKNKDFSNVIGEQVTVDNCVDWFPLIGMVAAMNGAPEITVIQDTLCMQAVKETINERKAPKSSSNRWNLQPLNNAFLQAILNMVEHMHDKDRILLVLYMVFCQSPDGADQLESIEECYQFSMKHQNVLHVKPQTIALIDKIKQKYPVIKAQHKLHLYGLYDDELSSLISNPPELIKALYNRPNVFTVHCKLDLNKVAADFCNLFNLDTKTIQCRLLTSWFKVDSSSNDGNPLDQTFCDTDLNASAIQLNDGSEFSDDIVEKAYYILKSWKREDARSILVNGLAYNDDGSLLDSGHNLQLYDCLIKLTDKHTIAEFKSLIPDDKYVALKCVYYLKPLGFNLTIEKFHSYDKVAILKQIWSTNATNPKALQAMCFICFGYNIFEPKLWNGILRQMIQTHMDKELLAIIRRISGKEQLAQKSDGLVMAYEYLIRLPFKSINKVHSTEQDELVCESLLLFQSCPVRHKLKLVDLAESCIISDQLHIASIIMVLSNEPERNRLNKMLKPLADQKLRKNVIRLEELGVYPFTTKRALSLLGL